MNSINKKKKVGILTGGGDTPPLNAVIFILRSRIEKKGFDFIGFEKGWEGVLSKKFVDLKTIPDFGSVGGTVLKSSRVNLSAGDGFQRANQNLTELGVDVLVVIGGDDTLSNVYGIESVPCIGVSKTIDNDVGTLSVEGGKIKAVNYFTLGYPTAADRIARLVSLEEGLRTTAYSHERILIVESMGMHAGWLASASAFGRPDFIIVPEFPLDYPSFLYKLKEQYGKDNHSIIVIAEGARLSGGAFIQFNPDEGDAFGNPRFGGSSFAMQDRLKTDLKEFMDVRNINAVNPSYLYRSGAPSPLDKQAAGLVAETCSRLILEGPPAVHQFVAIEWNGSGFEAKSQPFSSFPKTKEGRFPKRFMDTSFYDPKIWSVTKGWRTYLEPVVSFCSSAVNYRIS